MGEGMLKGNITIVAVVSFCFGFFVAALKDVIKLIRKIRKSDSEP